MKFYHGMRKTHEYFEGWYFKHQEKDKIISFIPGISIDQNGCKVGFIQVITNGTSYFVSYPYKQCYFDKRNLYIRIGRNLFTHRGIKIDIKRSELNIKGKLYYGKLSKLDYDIMGPFKLLPCMECNHRVYSLSHKVVGELIINKEAMDFMDGTGYIESDWGSSFPHQYLWSQCNYFKNKAGSVMISIATIPMLKYSFTGCIGVIQYNNKQMRFATYLGAKVIFYNGDGCLIQQGKYKLYVRIKSDKVNELKAPKSGDMIRKIDEGIICFTKYQLYKNDSLILSLTSNHTSMEYVKM